MVFRIELIWAFTVRFHLQNSGNRKFKFVANWYFTNIRDVNPLHVSKNHKNTCLSHLICARRQWGANFPCLDSRRRRFLFIFNTLSTFSFFRFLSVKGDLRCASMSFRYIEDNVSNTCDISLGSLTMFVHCFSLLIWSMLTGQISCTSYSLYERTPWRN